MPPAKVLIRLPDLEHDALVRRARRARRLIVGEAALVVRVPAHEVHRGQI